MHPSKNLFQQVQQVTDCFQSNSFLSSLYFLSAIMAFRAKMGHWKTLLRSRTSAYSTATTTKMKAYSPAADYMHFNEQGKASKTTTKKNFVPVYVAIGMIALATGLGLHTAWQLLRNSPTVRVKKQRRETLPEVVDPDHVVEEADKFLKKSFFRKVAHVQEYNNPEKEVVPDPIHKDAYVYRPRVETLKSVGVDPTHV